MLERIEPGQPLEKLIHPILDPEMNILLLHSQCQLIAVALLLQSLTACCTAPHSWSREWVGMGLLILRVQDQHDAVGLHQSCIPLLHLH